MPLTPIKKNNVTICGNESAPQTLMFGHGFGLDQTSFSEVIKPFEKDYKIVLYDNMGGGKSAMEVFSPLRYASLKGYVSDLLDILKYLDLKNVNYVGHSVNGMVGMLTSIEHPEYFRKLVLLGASPRYLNDPDNGYIGGFTPEDLNGLYEAMRSNYHVWASGFSKVAMSNADRPQLAEAFAATLSAIRPDVALAVAKAIFESDHRNDLAKSIVPTLIIQTSNDIAVPTVVGDYMKRHIPKSTLVKVDTEGHFPQMSAPKEVIHVIKMFL